MVEKSKLKPLASAVGITLAATLAASPLVMADQNPFSVSEMSGGYMIAGAEGEGKCGEGKCGEGKCGGDKAEEEGKCGEGKCGEGKCGAAEGEGDEAAE